MVSALLLTFLLEESWPSIERLHGSLLLGDDSKLDALSAKLSTLRASLQPIIELLTEDSTAFANRSWAGQGAIKESISGALPNALNDVRSILGDSYSPFMQEVGDNVRKSGTACGTVANPDKLFALPARIVRAIECIRQVDKASVSQKETRIAIDAIRNPLELVYLRDRYATLYVVAITADEGDRHGRLLANQLKDAAITVLDNREYPVPHKPLESYEALISQDIQSCLQKSDIFVSNPGLATKSKSKLESSTGHMYAQLMRYYAMALHPGLVTPSRDERCMQIAFTAKVNSGCISRQVGAVVTDENFAVKAIGWNDVPKGQAPCALRNVDEVLNGSDKITYSRFELENDGLRRHIGDKFASRKNLSTQGLPCPYCFKDAVNKSGVLDNGKPTKDQVHTRSLHAEENAFLQLTTGGGTSVKGGKLFTTASPCELCSKKAFQLGVSDIVYIDPYPGISISHVIANGLEKNRPIVRLFSGAVGKAYHRLYEPMLPVKDELMARMQMNTESVTS